MGWRPVRLTCVTDLIDTTEMYLRTIFELEEEGITPLRARIAERLGHSGPTVSQTVARMERDGLLAVAGDRHLELSEQGRTLATRVMRKHRIAERLLVDIIGLEWEYVHDEACRWEHVMSEQVERRLVELLNHPSESPYGNPIPGLSELGESLKDTDFLEEQGILTQEVRSRKEATDAGIGSNGGGNGNGNGNGNGGSHTEPVADTGGTAVPAGSALTDSPPVMPAALKGAELGPACEQCGGMMQRTGSCYTCSSCGNNTGCG